MESSSRKEDNLGDKRKKKISKNKMIIKIYKKLVLYIVEKVAIA